MPPTPSQLLSAYLTIHAASKIQKKRMLAFYNGGENAGASQSWRHLQVVGVDKDDGIPMDEWMEGLEVERKGE
jgi:ATP adenylyltransferase